MARKSTDKSTITESPTAAPDEWDDVVTPGETFPEIPALEPVDKAEDPQPDPTPAPKPKAVDPLPAHITQSVWGGQELWHCARCGADTFKESEARSHECTKQLIRF